MPKHILIIMTDQCRADALGAYGCEYAQTPALDGLAAGSAVFERAVTPSPVCVPARLCMMSGRYCVNTGNATNNKAKAWNGKGFYSMLTEAGYDSYQVGKMHYVWDSYGTLGFAHRKTQEEMSNPGDDYTNFIMSSPYRNVFDYNGHRSEMYYVPQVSQLPAEYHPTAWVGDRMVEYIERCDPSKPVFLMSSFIHPHPPFCPPAPWNKLFRRDDLPGPFVPPETPQLKYLLDPNLSGEALDLSRLDLLRLKNFYYACLSFVDYHAGRILDALKRKGMYDDTLIVFTSDHGECLGDYYNMGKRTMMSCASRIPLMVKIPGREGCRRSDAVSLVDLAPTLLDWAGVPYDPSLFDGRSILDGSGGREFVYSQYGWGKTGTWMIAGDCDKLIFNAATDRYAYFDGTPERFDRYDPSVPRIARMKELLDAHVASDVTVSPPKAPGAEKPGKGKKLHRFGVARMDHFARADEERARIPEGYTIDLQRFEKQE